jgi:dTDP-glucose 4,6-dehydratase
MNFLRTVSKVYVTGCLGFIASHLTRLLLNNGVTVIGIDKITYAADAGLLDEFERFPNFSFKRQDICDITEIEPCDYFINVAAESHVDNSIDSSDIFIQSNISGVHNILKVLNKIPKENRPILFHFSTDEVYGDILEGFHNESDPLIPSNPYSATKAAADMLIFAWSRTHKIDYIMVRPANNYGIGQFPEKLIPASVKNLRAGEKIKLHNQGSPIRTWLHVEDTAEAVFHIMKHGEKNQIYNITSYFELKNTEVAENILRLFNVDESRFAEYIDFSCKRAGQDMRYGVSCEKLEKLGWKAQRNFEQELEKIVRSSD